MVRTSGIRQKLRSKVLNELARERAHSVKQDGKRAKLEAAHHKDESETSEDSDADQDKPRARASTSNNSLLSILPRPKESFGPTIRLDKLLKMPERAEKPEPMPGMEEHCFHSAYSPAASIDTKTSTVVLPKGKEKQKNQITYLAQLGKAKELEHKELAAKGRLNKAATRSKYGW